MNIEGMFGRSAANEEGNRVMRVVVLGATGGTGLEIVRQAIGRGHAVTAFVRPNVSVPMPDRST